jgi:ATP-binding protein involved in chromosome partitioning
MAFWNRTKKPAPTPSHSHAGHTHAHGDHSHEGHSHAGHSHSHAASPQPPAGATSGGARPFTTQPTGPATRSGPAALAGVKNVIAIASGKGGVGKSTVTTNLAVALKFAGASVGLLDADVYGPSQPGMLGATGAAGQTTAEGALIPVDRFGVRFISMGLLMGNDGPLVWRAPMATKVIQQFLGNVQWGNLDYLLIDLPPGTGDVQLTLAQQASLAGAVIVTTPQQVALGIAKKGLEMFRQLNIPILGIIENMSGFTCEHCGKDTAVFKEGGGAKLAATLGVPFLGAIPLDTEIMMSGDDGVPVLARETHGDPGATSHAAQAFLTIASNFDKQVRLANGTENALEPQGFELAPTGELLLRWPDGHGSVFRPWTMRVNCGCASCIDENTGRPLLDPKRIPLDIRFKSVDPVGRYALTASFTDGHSTGIYPFKKLRALCECPDCTGKRAETSQSFTV